MTNFIGSNFVGIVAAGFGIFTLVLASVSIADNLRK